MDLATPRILLTGGAGFLGRAVAERLRARGAREIFIPRRKDYDLTHEADVARLYRDANPDLVIHLAAEVGGIGANQANPGRYFFANMAMALHLIELGRIHGIRKFVQAGTICAYPKFTPVPFHEDRLWDGYPEETNAPYGVAKKAAMVMLDGYHRQYGLASSYLLPVNLYGPWDNFDLTTSHVIPALIRKCIEAAEVMDEPTPINLGTGMEITIKDLVTLIARLCGFTGEIRWDATKPDGQPRRCLDTERAAKLLGWRAQVGFEEGLTRTIEWYRGNRGHRASHDPSRAGG